LVVARHDPQKAHGTPTRDFIRTTPAAAVV
jgi:hypothetical protein